MLIRVGSAAKMRPRMAPEAGEAQPWLLVAVVLALVVGLSLLVEAGAPDREPTGLGAAQRASTGDGGGDEAAGSCGVDAQLVTSRVEEIRGLEFEGVPEIECVPTGEIIDRVKELAKESAEPTDRPTPKERKRIRAESEASVITLKLSGLLPPNFDETADPVASAGLEAAGVYVPEAGALVISPGPESERYLAHELVHALEDQNFGVEREQTRSSEADAGFEALVEGSATYYEVLYAERFLDSGVPPREAIRARSLLEAPSGSPALAQYLLFPYLAGGQFVATLVERGGNETVDQAYEDPPISTEQVLQPEAWFDRDPFAMIKSTGAGTVLPKAWRRVGAGEAGEVDAILTLEQSGNSTLAQVGAEGLAGGRYEAWTLPGDCKPPCRGKRVAIISYRFDSDQDAVQFEVAAKEYAEKGLGADKPALQSEARTKGGSVSTVAYALDNGGIAVSEGTGAGAIVFAPAPRLASDLALHAALAAEGGSPSK